MTDKTGGSAFPMIGSVAYNSDWSIDPGMTLRDYFAAKAMASVPLALDSNEQQLIANAAYAQADAMLRAREK
ncbi:hypothetical protein [Morganella morganii]|uniref:hypothetical protein n=1 Tax=Morganella morganii TaxID=582 RepID=UPI0005693C73|nr:hypothetical protein [Morganella morganii]MBT0400435.1 hypothetical protein [Morganella morganii subsp. morganii]ELN8405948.1 hypothetical protein [Morganella morganii]OPL25456.1 hypothetical protein B5S45_09780 [Morganella morganii]RTY17343.1 hypothetical protein EKS23_18055 [Morganella morganii subsp. morganii]